MKHRLLIMVGIVLLSGCVVHPPSVEVPVVRVGSPVQVISPAPAVRYYGDDDGHKHKHKHGHKHKHHHDD